MKMLPVGFKFKLVFPAFLPDRASRQVLTLTAGKV